MCEFFSFITEPKNYPGQKFYLDWEYRKDHLSENDADSHAHICSVHNIQEDICNKYEYNPILKILKLDNGFSEINDCVQVERWVQQLDFAKIVPSLIIKIPVNPFTLPKCIPTEDDIQNLKLWDSVRASVGDSVGASVGASVWDSVRASVGDSVGASVWDSVRASVGASFWDSVRAYLSSFFNIAYPCNYSPLNISWNRGLVPSFDGTVWRLHSGKNAEIVWEEKHV